MRKAAAGRMRAGARGGASHGRVDQVTVTATEAQNQFGQILDSTSQDREVVITRHNSPRAVLMSMDRYRALVTAEAAALDTLTGEFDALLERMQTPAARTGVRRAFGASPRELGKAAVTAARKGGRGG